MNGFRIAAGLRWCCGAALSGMTVVFLCLVVASCAVNPATGEKQFTALMSPAQEISAGAQEHEKVMRTYGAPQASDPLQAYVESVGRRIAAQTERKDVSYKFFLLDTPMLNAFALPGGYVYVTRGILAQANSEDELAAVLAHEIGHVTARHAAERYSHGVLSSLGAVAIAAAADNAQAARVAGIGSDLYIKSYSRKQESQSDELGVRYLSKADYDPLAMARFLENLRAGDELEARLSGKGGQKNIFDGYFSTHPQTAERIQQAVAMAQSYPAASQGDFAATHLDKINGMIYGDSARQGFVRDGAFWHPDMGFVFSVPPGFRVDNQPQQVVLVNRAVGAVALLDTAPNKTGADPQGYIAHVWMKDKDIGAVERIDINGMKAATAAFPGVVDNKPMTIRLVAVAWAPDKFFRFQVAIPQGASASLLDDLKHMTYSLRAMSAAEKNTIQPLRLRLVTAGVGDSVSSLASRMALDEAREDYFRVLNGIKPGESIAPGRRYKTVSRD